MAFRIRKLQACFLIEVALILTVPLHAYAEENVSGIEVTLPDDTSASSGVSAKERDDSESMAMKPIEKSRDVRVQLPGFSHHFSAPAAAGRKWNEKNYGAGLELRDPINDPNWTGWSTLESAGLMKDSLGVWGGYAGVAWQKRFLDAKYTLDFGPSFWLLWRTLDFDGPHLLIPIVLPSLSVENKADGWGMNSVLIPGFRWHDKEMPTVLWIGITKSY